MGKTKRVMVRQNVVMRETYTEFVERVERGLSAHGLSLDDFLPASASAAYPPVWDAYCHGESAEDCALGFVIAAAFNP